MSSEANDRQLASNKLLDLLPSGTAGTKSQQEFEKQNVTYNARPASSYGYDNRVSASDGKSPEDSPQGQTDDLQVTNVPNGKEQTAIQLRSESTSPGSFLDALVDAAETSIKKISPRKISSAERVSKNVTRTLSSVRAPEGSKTVTNIELPTSSTFSDEADSLIFWFFALASLFALIAAYFVGKRIGRKRRWTARKLPK